jgi:type I restriction enzyme S subunit
MKLSGNDFVDEGFPAYGAGGLNGRLAVAEFDRSAVILSAIGARCGKCFLAEGRWTSLANTQLIFPDESRVDVRFLWYQLNDEARWPRAGVAQPFIKPSDVKSHLVILPPLEEQKRIAAILDQADALRRLRARALDRLNALGQAIFHEMFGGKTTAPLRCIAEFADVKGGKRLPKGSDYSDGVTAHPYIRVSDLGDLKIDTSAIKYISPEIQKSVWRYTVSEGDVVISIAGSIGITAAVPERLNGANLTENAAKITPKKGVEFDPTYLSWALSMPEAKSQIVASTGQVTIGKLALFRIEQIEVPMPSIELQRAFSNALNEMDASGDTAMRSRAVLDTLFTSLQHRAFRGEL